MHEKVVSPILLSAVVAAFGLACTTVVQAKLPDPVAFWRFEEGRGDTTADVGTGNHPGTLVGDVGFVSDPERGTVLEFGSGESYVETNAWITELGPANFSIAAWIKTSEQGAAILGKSNLDRTWSFHEKQFYLSRGTEQGTPVAGGVHFYGNQAGEIWGATAVNDGVWHHVCVTWDNTGKVQHIYVDGKLDDLKPVWVYYGGRGDNVTDSVRIGYDCSGDATSDFIGRMDDVAMFNVTLTPGQVQELAFLRQPATASMPTPGDQVTDLPRRGIVLGWKAGLYAATHDVYFGTNPQDVNNATRTNPLGVLVGQNQIPNSYPAAGSMNLEFGTTYYWRIDEVNAPPTSTIRKGELWSFTTEPLGYPIAAARMVATASSSAPGQGPVNTINGSGLTGDLHGIDLATMWLTDSTATGPAWIQYDFDQAYKLVQMWVWNHNSKLETAVGFGAKDVAITYSANGADYTDLGATQRFARAPGKVDYAHNTTVDLGGIVAKAVRLTINNNWGGILKQYGLSEVQLLSLPVWAREPSPVAGATGVKVDATLNWRSGREAAQHKVYLSANQQAVIDGTAPVVTVNTTSYTPALDVGRTYYWRIDEANNAETPALWSGLVWSFSTQQYLVVDDFESYNDDLNAGTAIFQVWVDGYGIATNGSLVGYDTSPFAERTTVNSGRQSMPLAYDNTGATNSETTRTFTSPQDWRQHGVKALTLRFYGDAANVAQQMYVKINNTKILYNGAADNLKTEKWQLWYIDLTTQSVSSVTKLSIGFDRLGGAAGKGSVFIDDIRLYSADQASVTVAASEAAGL